MPEPITTGAVLLWIWKELKDNIIQFGKDKSKQQWEEFQWDEAAVNYVTRIQDSYGRVFILGSGDKPLQDIFTYINVLDRVTAEQKYAPEHLEATYLKRHTNYKQDESKDGLGLIQTGQDFFVLGKPGSGKTTFLKSIALKTIKGELFQVEEEHRLPIFIFLREHADSERKTLFESIEYELQTCGFPDVPAFVETLLNSGKAILLLDGLDEVKKEEDIRKTVIRDIINLRRKYPQTQFVITCRVADTNYEFQEINTVEMADFNDGQIQIFLRNWFHDEELTDSCWEALQDSDTIGLLELARSPLLLTLLALSYEESLEFASSRVEIYEIAIEALVKKWDAKRLINRNYNLLNPKQKFRLFEHIAYIHFLEKDFIFKESNLTRLLADYINLIPNITEDSDGQEILESIAAQHGIFVERSQRLWSFSHLTFHEFFTAKFIDVNTSHGTLENLFEHVNDQQWREVFLMTASLLNSKDAEDFFELFLFTLKNLILDVDEIQSFLTLINEKVQKLPIELPYTSAAMRMQLASAYTSTKEMASIRTIASARSGASASVSDTIMNNAISSDSSIAKAIAIASSQSNLSSDTIDEVIDRVKGMALVNVFTEAKATDVFNAMTKEIAIARNHLIILNDSTNLSLDEVIQLLESFDKLFDLSRLSIWDDFINILLLVETKIQKETGLNLLKVAEPQKSELKVFKDPNILQTLTDYLEKMFFLIECLQYANIKDRNNIINQLLLPTSLKA